MPATTEGSIGIWECVVEGSAQGREGFLKND